jgi:DNA-binding NarL/FixJ family response regulator
MQPYVAMLQADEDDRMLTESILEQMEHRVPMHFINRINELKDMISASGLPSIILINNSDHRHKAIDMVKHLKKDATLSHIPVIVLGEITTPDYIKQYYRAGANTYITKPSTVAATQKKIRLFLDYWFEAAEI